MITGLYLMYSEDTRFQSTCYSAAIQVVGKLKVMHCLCFVQSFPKYKHTPVVQYYSLTSKLFSFSSKT